MKTRIAWTFALLFGFAAVESPDASASASPQIAAKNDRLLPRKGLFAQAETQDLRPGDEFVAGGELYRVASTGRFVGTGIVPEQLELLHRPYDRERSRSPTPDDVVWLVSSDAGGLHSLIAAAARCHGLALMTVDRGIRDSGTVAIA